MSTSPNPPFIGVYAVDLFECPPFQMFTADDCTISMYIRSGRFEPMSTKVWAKLAKDASCIIDVGANVGVYSFIAAALRADVEIHAFEPNPYAFSRLRVNKRINSFENIIEHPYALSNSERIDRLSWVRKGDIRISSGGTLARTSHEKCATAPVDVKTFDSLGINLGPRGLVKIDAEGAEGTVIVGMMKALANRPDIIIETFDETLCNQLNALLGDFKYFTYTINETTMQLVKTNGLKAADYDAGNFNSLLTTREL
jgi:FkbM family methyltransferase